MTPPEAVDAYIALHPLAVRRRLEEMRVLVKKLVPGGDEKIGYGIPTATLNGRNLLHYAAFEKHIGVYATPSGNAAFQKELLAYKTGKGSIQFPLTKPMPWALIEKIIRFRVEELSAKAKTKTPAKAKTAAKTKNSAKTAGKTKAKAPAEAPASKPQTAAKKPAAKKPAAKPKKKS